MTSDGDANRRDRLRRIGVRAAFGLRDDLVDHSQSQQVRRGQAQRLRGARDVLLGRLAPQNRAPWRSGETR